MSDGPQAAATDWDGWIRRLAAERRWGDRDRLGRAHLIDRPARLRGVKSVQSGDAISLSRPMVPTDHNIRGDATPGLEVELFSMPYPNTAGIVASDHVRMDSHGHAFTHLDGLNHLGFEDTWYSGWPATFDNDLSVGDFAVEGLLTRGVLADIPAVRGTPWIAVDEPLTAEDLDLAIAAAGVDIEPGDALLLYMGRDAYEAAGHPYPAERRPGVGRSATGWLADRDISMLAWDFLDANLPGTVLSPTAHMLLWAAGLVLVDSCDYADAVPRMRAAHQSTGLFCVAPLRIARATGVQVNPMILI